MLLATTKVVQLCAQGRSCKGKGEAVGARLFFGQTWQEAATTTEKAIAAHYVARQQPGVAEKLNWDKRALELALQTPDASARGFFPSLYLNIAKGYEDLGEWQLAQQHYLAAQSFTGNLIADGYGQLIKTGIANGLQRIAARI